jgi:ribosomal protein L10
MTPIKGIMTRYAKKMVNNRYFGIIDVQGITTFDMNTLR